MPAPGAPVARSWRAGLKGVLRRAWARVVPGTPTPVSPPVYAEAEIDAAAVNASEWLRGLRAAAQDRGRPAPVVWADEASRRWLCRLPAGLERVRPWPPDSYIADATQPALLILRADSLPTLADRCPPAGARVAVWVAVSYTHLTLPTIYSV